MLKLKLNEKIEKINEEIEKTKNNKNWYVEEITEKNKKLKMGKNTLSTLQENGIKLEKTYISYNDEMGVYNIILEILKLNDDIFYNKTVK